MTTLAEDLATLAGVVHAMPGKDARHFSDCVGCERDEKAKQAATEALARVHAIAVTAVAAAEAGRVPS